MTDRSAAVAELVASLPEGVVATTPEALEKYRRDWAKDPDAGMPCATVRAESADHVQVAVRWAASHGIPVVPRGAGSGLSGGASAVEGGLVVSLERMTAIEIDPAARCAVVEPGRLQRRRQEGRRRARPLVPAGPELVRDLLDRRQRRDQRGRPVLRQVRRDDRLRPRARRRPRRRAADHAWAASASRTSPASRCSSSSSAARARSASSPGRRCGSSRPSSRRRRSSRRSTRCARRPTPSSRWGGSCARRWSSSWTGRR